MICVDPPFVPTLTGGSLSAQHFAVFLAGDCVCSICGAFFRFGKAQTGICDWSNIRYIRSIAYSRGVA